MPTAPGGGGSHFFLNLIMHTCTPAGNYSRMAEDGSTGHTGWRPWQEMVAEVLQLQCRGGLKRRWRGARWQEVYVSMMHLLADAWNGRRIWNRVVCLNKGLQWEPAARRRGAAASETKPMSSVCGIQVSPIY